MFRRPPGPSLFPYTTLFRSAGKEVSARVLPDRILGYGGASSSGAAASQGVEIPDAGVDFEKVVATTERLYLQAARSEEHTSELQSRFDLVCRLLLEKKNTIS